MTTEPPRPPRRTARQVTLSAIFLGTGGLVTIAGLVGALLLAVPPLGPLILVAVLVVQGFVFMPFVARGRAPWVIPLVGLSVMAAGWGAVLGLWHLGTLAL
jgi:hypothetical protein